MVQRDVAPEHQLSVVRFQQIANAIQMLKINRTHALRLRLCAALTFPQLERFVGANVKELSGKEFVQLLVPIGD